MPSADLKDGCSFFIGCALSTRVHHLRSPTVGKIKAFSFSLTGMSAVSLPYLWKPIPFILSSPASSLSSTDFRRHTSAISCFVRDPWGLAGVEGFRPLVTENEKMLGKSFIMAIKILAPPQHILHTPHTTYSTGTPTHPSLFPRHVHNGDSQGSCHGLLLSPFHSSNLLYQHPSHIGYRTLEYQHLSHIR